MNADTDTYLLLSKAGVLEPHWRKILSKDIEFLLERKALKAETPAHLRNVPYARMQYVKRSLQASAKDKNE